MTAELHDRERWPALRLESWLATHDTLHRWLQIVGKTRLGLAPFVNHWWNAALYITARGLTTSPMPNGDDVIEVEFDFLNDQLVAKSSNGETRALSLENKSVADFYHEYRELLSSLGVQVHINGTPNEIPDATRFSDDTAHASYDGDAVRECWHALVDADRVLKEFRSRFAGKCSPSHFWWGGFDLACTRFSGRPAPRHPGGIPNCPDYVMVEAYSHECISAGWWPGTAGSSVAEPAFYAYAYPEPAGCDVTPIAPESAYFDRDMRLWILPQDEVRKAKDPEALVLEFLQSTYDTGSALSNWDTAALQSAWSSIT
jgi:hypothetical protein